MDKMKVHELAKELGIQSKDVLTFLADKGIEVKAAQSSIESDAIEMVRKKFGGKTESSEAKPAKADKPADKAPEKAADKTAATKPAEKPAGAGAEPVKKKKIIFVNNPHNSKLPGQGGNRSAQAQGGQARPQGKPVQNQGKGGHTISGNEYTHQIIKPRQDVINKQLSERRAKEEAARKEEAAKAAASAPVQEQKPTRPMNVVIEEAPKKEYIRPNNNDRNQNRDNRDNRDNRGQGRPDGKRQGQNQGQRDGFRRPAQGGQARPGQGMGRPGQGGKPNIGAASAAPAPTSGGRRDDKFKNKNYDNNRDGEKKNTGKRGQEKERGNKNYLMQDDEETLAMKRRTGKFIKPEKKPEVEEEAIKVITIDDTITIKDLADKMKIVPANIVKKLFLQGKVVNVNSEISFEEAEEIAIEYEIICEHEVKVDVIEELLKEEEESDKDMVARPPVVCVMGHVDHGKTSLLDAVRKTHVIDREAGGITQAIGAYTVNVKGRDITFLDTPGHEAFTAMRMRGANSTDIAVLVVAADDGVMPQTVEAINHAKAAGVEIIVAVNKIDKPGANPERVKQELSEYELIPTDWGGTTEFVNISAKRGDGIDDLLETILLTADILELKANPKRRARGIVIEAELDKGRGPVATVLVQKGTLKGGDFVSAGACHGKVRAMVNDKGKSVKTAGPSIPVEILGLDAVPNAGDVFIAHDSDKEAKQFAETFIAQNKEKKLEETKAAMSLDDLFSKIQEGNLKELNLIIKADVQGSVEAVKQSLTKLSNEEVVVKVIHGGVGAINESDVSLALASSAIIIGFNVKPDAQAKATAEHEGVDIRLYNVIYKAIEDVEAAMKGMLDPVFEEKIIGHAEVRQIFKASAIGKIAGSYVLDGVFQRDCKIRIRRGDEQIYEGSLASLKRFKDDVKEVKAGFECGLVFDGFDSMEELDIVEAYIMVEVPR
ncbi:MAG: translation initiation factor IF-2 [Lachnospiraceae bacterium]|nr:translation initiation factor IF-2 [Lachnospiraceae bacterium]